MKLVKTLNLTLLPPHPEVDYSHGDFYSTMRKSPPLKIDLFPCCYMCIQVHIISVTLYLLQQYYQFACLSFCNTYHLVFLSQITGAWHPTSYIVLSHFHTLKSIFYTIT